ncbi:Bromodomain and WD repeat-containing protein 3 [Smittium mucronatum]|uniref:Bromodomain and WD repeat-containing protein 3 n=1 Tax=Smittium mucronatum TaxID=133383 RepID=A0A1R0GTS6_9FUNG|nr:Bromodomain and WD repeat-containing protein 3 [Smittium mucronatum]
MEKLTTPSAESENEQGCLGLIYPRTKSLSRNSLPKIPFPQFKNFLFNQKYFLPNNINYSNRLPLKIISKYKELVKCHGHKFPTFCVIFDRNGKRMITGSDDYLVKIWCTRTGYLIQTLRGHRDVITDMSLNFENTLLASASSDGTVRIWNLKSGKPEAVLTGSINSPKKGIINVHFSPSPIPQTRYLAAVAEDGNCYLYKWDRITMNFCSIPVIIDGKYTKGDAITSMTFNKTGSRLAFSTKNGYIQIVTFISEAFKKSDNNSNSPIPGEKIDTDQIICNSSTSFLKSSIDIHPSSNIDLIEWGGPKPLSVFLAHSVGISTLVYSNDGSKLLSGAIDGSAYVWEFDKIGSVKKRINVGVGDVYCEYNLQNPNFIDNHDSIILHQSPDVNVPGANQDFQNNQGVYSRIIESNQVAWSCDDSVVLVSNSVGLVSAFDSKTGDRLWATRLHGFQEVFVLIAHPTDRRIAVSGGYNGHVVVWDVTSGNPLNDFSIDEQIFDGSFSDNGSFFAVAGETGAAYLFGNSENERQYKDSRRMSEQIFFSDYTRTIQDSEFHVIDEITQIAPHLMDPGPLQDFDGRQFRIQKGPGFGLDLEVGLDPIYLQSFDQPRLLDLQEELLYVPLLSLAVKQTATHNNPTARAERSNASNTRAIYYAEGELPIYIQEDDENDQDYPGIPDAENDSQEDDIELVMSEDENENIIVREHNRGNTRGNVPSLNTAFIPGDSVSRNRRGRGRGRPYSDNQTTSRRSDRGRGRGSGTRGGRIGRSAGRRLRNSTRDLDSDDREFDQAEENQLQSEMNGLYRSSHNDNHENGGDDNNPGNSYYSTRRRGPTRSIPAQEAYMSLRNRSLGLDQLGAYNLRSPSSRRAYREILNDQQNSQQPASNVRRGRSSARNTSPPLYAEESDSDDSTAIRSRRDPELSSSSRSVDSIQNVDDTNGTRGRLNLVSGTRSRNRRFHSTTHGTQHSDPDLHTDDSSNPSITPNQSRGRKPVSSNVLKSSDESDSNNDSAPAPEIKKNKSPVPASQNQTPNNSANKYNFRNSSSSSKNSRKNPKPNYNEESSSGDSTSHDESTNDDFEYKIEKGSMTPTKLSQSSRTLRNSTRVKDSVDSSGSSTSKQKKTTRSGREVNPPKSLQFGQSASSRVESSTQSNNTPRVIPSKNKDKKESNKTILSSSPDVESPNNVSLEPLQTSISKAPSIKIKLNNESSINSISLGEPNMAVNISNEVPKNSQMISRDLVDQNQNRFNDTNGN